MISDSMLRAKTCSDFSNHELYKSIVGALQYVTLTRPNSSFSMNKVYQYMSQPKDAHWVVVKIILRYLSGTIQHGLEFQPSTYLQINGFVDFDWGYALMLDASHLAYAFI